ncbi:GNAT family N-acetyltransferase [Streptomyces sp. NPDC050535]|uniref:GNAT family N-acetyltransferase n=1 Tax=Streptomyces sp. NPDC050535 TaxID=3365626 RepID=UPI003788683B
MTRDIPSAPQTAAAAAAAAADSKVPPPDLPPLTFRRATEADLTALVRLRDAAANWQVSRGIDQWTPGEMTETHFRANLQQAEVWLAFSGPDPAPDPVGAWELWWEDPAAWGPQPPTAAYIHRLMTDRATAPPGTGRHLLAAAEHRITTTARPLARLDCLTANTRLHTYYESAGYTQIGERHVTAGLGDPYTVTLFEKQLH